MHKCARSPENKLAHEVSMVNKKYNIVQVFTGYII